jgi:hypothetical protein
MANEFQHKDPGSTLTQAEYITTDGTGHIFDCQATGDIMYASSATVLKNLAKATDGNILELASGLPAWTASPTIGSTSWANATHAHAASNSGGTLTTVGALDAGSITSGFGTIDTGASAITTTGLISGGSLDIDNVLINGTTIGHTCDSDLITVADACLTIKGAVTVGVDDTGHDVKFFGAAAGAYMLYDQSCDQLEIRGASADAATSTGKLLLTTALTNINACDVIGSINFQAPLEAGDCDSRLVAAGIRAVAQATFTCAVNATDLIFYTGHSEAAAERFRFTSQNEIGIAGANYGTDGQVLTSGGAGAAVAWEDAGGGGPCQANQAAIEGETNQDTYIPPDLVKHSPGVAKSWVNLEQAGTHAVQCCASYNICGVADGGTGLTTVTLCVDHSGTKYTIAGTSEGGDDFQTYNSAAAGSYRLDNRDSGANNVDGAGGVTSVTFGDQ